MRKLAASVVVASAVMGLAVSQALADAPKFFSANSSVSNDGELVVTFDERGLGNENVDYTVTADADATYACINKGGKNPSAANKRSVEASVEANESFEPRNGRVAGRITAGPPSAGTFSCPGGQHLELLSVTYDHIVLTDTTNDVSTSVPDASGP
jgi:hypothetical protein